VTDECPNRGGPDGTHPGEAAGDPVADADEVCAALLERAVLGPHGGDATPPSARLGRYAAAGTGTVVSTGSGSPGQPPRMRAMASRSAAVTHSSYFAFTATWRAT
jgi:hypothetical protein